MDSFYRDDAHPNHSEQQPHVFTSTPKERSFVANVGCSLNVCKICAPVSVPVALLLKREEEILNYCLLCINSGQFLQRRRAS